MPIDKSFCHLESSLDLVIVLVGLVLILKKLGCCIVHPIENIKLRHKDFHC